jgi:hypothetical protein
MGVGGVVSFVILLPHCCHSTHDPPHKQLLVGLGAGVVSSIMCQCWHHWGMQPVAPKPPCEQVLTAVGGGCWCLPSLVSLAPWHGTHLQTTLQAAAYRHGIRCHVIPSSPSLSAISILNPPCEQLLAAVEVGVVLVVVVIALAW